MPFDGSGNFSRLYRWQSDRDNNIRIMASRMDGEFDNFAAGMNSVFFRNGLVPMSGNLNMGQNSVTGLAAGSVNAPSVRFGDDPNSGIFLSGLGNVGLVSGGTTRAMATNAGLAVTGVLTTTGAVSAASLSVFDANFGLSAIGGNPIYTADVGGDRMGYNRVSDFWDFQIAGVSKAQVNTNGMYVIGGLDTTSAIRQAGNQVWHAGNLNPALYAQVAGGTFTGQVYGSAGMRTGPGAYAVGQALWYTSSALGTVISGAPGANSDFFIASRDGQDVMTVPANTRNANFAANVSVAGTLNATALTNNGAQVWHTGNLNPANYMPTSGGTFSGNVAVQSAGSANIGIVSTTAGATDVQLRFVTPDRVWHIGQNIGASGQGHLHIYDVNGGGPRMTFTGAGASVTGALSSTGALTQNGNQVWHAGNFNPAGNFSVASLLSSGNVQAAGAGVALLSPSGDVTAYRSGGTTGVLYLNAAATRYLYNDGSAYQLPGQGLVVGGNISTTGGVSGGAMAVNGNAVWHAGNLNPANYAALAGAAFTGGVSINGNGVWHAGNLNPANYAALAGAAFTGGVSSNGNVSAGGAAVNGGAFDRVLSVFHAATAALTIATTGRQIQIGTIGADATTALGIYDSTAAAYRMKMNTSGVIDAIAGFTTRGGKQVPYDDMARSSFRITDGVAAPSGGSNGDMYFQYV